MLKSADESKTQLTELMIPTYANFGGKIHGGQILSLLDKAAYVCASKHADNYCVTLSVDRVEFLHPVEVGTLLHLLASVNYVGRTSLIVGVKVLSENFKTKSVVHTNSCYFTMVSVDSEGKPSKVPGLILKNELELRRFVEGRNRKLMNLKFKQEFEESRKELTERLNGVDLSSENCEIRL